MVYHHGKLNMFKRNALRDGIVLALFATSMASGAALA